MDIVEAIHAQNDRIRAALRKLEESASLDPAYRDEVIGLLIDELERKRDAQDDLIYAALAEYPDGVEAIEALRAAEQWIEQAASELQRHKDRPGFGVEAEALAARMREHFELEENEIEELVREHLDERRSREIGESFGERLKTINL